MAKRGRKPKLNSEGKTGYFYEEEEQAAVDFNNAISQEERDRIFNSKLRIPLTIMIESIIRRYNKKYEFILPDENFEDLFQDTYSYLLTKMDCFKPEIGKKAYSYYQTIVKHYLIGRKQKYTIERNRSVSYEDISSNLDENETYSYLNIYDSKIAFFNELIENTILDIKKLMANPIITLNRNEKKIGLALIEILNNRELLFENIGSDKFNKNSILYFLKETTFLSTKEIREGLKRYKILYFRGKESLLK